MQETPRKCTKLTQTPQTTQKEAQGYVERRCREWHKDRWELNGDQEHRIRVDERN
jgi:hypothetical protein